MTSAVPVQRVHSSRTVFLAIGAVLLMMTFFMFVCKHFGILNPRATWDAEFVSLKSVILEYDATAPGESAQLISPAAVKQHLEFYAGSQITIRKSSSWVVQDFKQSELNGKPIVMVKLAQIAANTPAQHMTFAIFPIADRQFQKTYKFALGSFLWRAYRWNMQNTKFIVTSENDESASDQVHMIAANYLNDYFIFAVGHASPKQLSIDVGAALSFYQEDFVKVL
jgi:hypothetical protein